MLKLIVYYISLIFTGTTLWILSFRLPFYNGTNIFFYRGIMLLITICIFLSITMILVKQKFKNFLWFFTYKDLMLCITIIFSLNMLFFTHVPVTADRSVSVFVLGLLNDENNLRNTMPKEEISKIFTSKYVNDYDAIGRRLSEQIASGNVEKSENEYKITARGKKLMYFYKFVARIFNIDTRIVSPLDK